MGGLEFIPGALHGIEATFLAMSNLCKLHSSIFEVVWSRRQPVASVGAVLSVQDGPQGVILRLAPVSYDSEVSCLPPF